MQLTIALFDGFTALDVVGGYEVLSNIPGMRVRFAAHTAGVVAADSGALGMMASLAWRDVAHTDILYVPGGPGVQAALRDLDLLNFVARTACTAAWIFGVCNGVEILGAAGLLTGRTVTTNFHARAAVAAYGATVLPKRYVRDGQLITGADVSSSIDAALFLASLIGGEALARTIELGIEYYPDPPFAGGNADTQPLAMHNIIAAVEANGARRLAARHIPFAHVTRSAKTTSGKPDM